MDRKNLEINPLLETYSKYIKKIDAALDTELELNVGYSKQELQDAMKGHIIAEAKLTGTFTP